ncbi:hypothetical protein ABK040_006354 [Willaertia magna]
MVRANKVIKATAEVDPNFNQEPVVPQTDLTTVIQDVERLREEENRKRREEHLKTRIRKIKDEEESLSRINLVNVNANWLHLLREAKLNELKDMIQILSQNHDRQVDRKDTLIQMLYRDLDEAEEQYRLALRTHMQHIDELLELQEQRLSSLQQDFNNDLYLLKKEYEEEKQELILLHEEEMKEWEEVTKEMEKREEKINEQMEQDFATNKEKVKNRYQEELIQMSGNMNEKIEEYEKLRNTEEINRGEEIKTKYEEYKKLRIEDSSYLENIKSLTYQIKVKEEALAHWKAKWINNLRECEERNKKLIKEKEQLAQHFRETKKKMNAFRESEKKRLTELVKMSKETIDTLKEKLEKGTRILKLGEINRRYETERERLLPFESDNDQTNSVAAISDSQMLPEVFDEEKKVQLDYEWEQLNRFYKRFNKVLLDNMALEQEKEHLVAQNKKLRQMLKQYLDGISVNEDVLNTKNPLFVVEGLNRPKEEVIIESNVNNNNAEKVKILANH